MNAARNAAKSRPISPAGSTSRITITNPSRGTSRFGYITVEASATMIHGQGRRQ